MEKHIDINCDLGESFGNWRLGNDGELLAKISSANVACGFHGGDPVTMVRTVGQAIELGVAVGAHPGLPDLLGFGRRAMDISADDAYAYVMYQAGALDALVRSHGAELHHVKPHGALYAMLNEREDLAEAVVEAVAALMEAPRLYWPAGAEDGALVQAARRRRFDVVLEFYPDMSYAPSGRMVLERHKVSVDPAVAVGRLARFLGDGSVETVDGSIVRLEAESICIHGDGASAPEIASTLREHLDAQGWTLRAPGAERFRDEAVPLR
jgi:UPF0271 protein